MTGFAFAVIVTLLVYVAACVAIGFLGWWIRRK